jgi:spermidine/putrescine transport system substrate-binding protein
MKKILTLIFCFFFAMFVVIACNAPNDNQNSNQTPVTNNNPETILNVYNWTTYIDPAVITEFEQKNNIKINYETYKSNEELYEKLKAGSKVYDLIFPSDYMVNIMIKENLLYPLNFDNIPNLKNIDLKFFNTPFDPEGKYSVPYQWGTIAIGYNQEVITNKPDSWGILFDPKYKNRVALLDDNRAVLGAVLMYLGFDANTTNPEEINQAKDYLLKFKDNIATFAPDTGDVLLNQGEVDLAMEYSGDIFQVMEENPKINFVIPKEGALISSDNMAIPTNATHKELAEKFINFVLEPEIGAKISNFIKYASPNRESIALNLINPEQLNNPAIYPPSELFGKLTYIGEVDSATQVYDQAWTEIKSETGK